MDYILYPKEDAKLLRHQLLFLYETLVSIECSFVTYCLHPFLFFFFQSQRYIYGNALT